jgi:hypothetical protein
MNPRKKRFQISKLRHHWGHLTPDNHIYDMVMEDYARLEDAANLPREVENLLVALGPGEYQYRVNGAVYFAQVIGGMIKALSHESFAHTLGRLNASELSARQINALRGCIKEGMATRQQKQTVYLYNCHQDLRRIRRSAFTSRREMLKHFNS